MKNRSSNRTRLMLDRAARQSIRPRQQYVEALDPRVLMSGTVVASVFEDVNLSGSKDALDTPLAGWTVFADYNGNGSVDSGEPSALSNSAGIATLNNNVLAGNWNITELLPSGWTPAVHFSNVSRTRVQDGRTANVSFLNVHPSTTGTIAGRVLNDVNGDGILTPDEPGIAGWTVYLDLNLNRSLDAGEPSRVTEATGAFTFGDVTPGRYKMRQISQPNWNPTIGFDGQNTVDVVAGATVVSNFANFNTAALGRIDGTIWNDLLADGFRSASDPGLSGWTIYLDLNSDGTLGAGEPSTLSDANGAFTFPSVAATTYKVTEVLQPGWSLSPGHPISTTILVNSEGTPAVTFANFSPTTGSITGKIYDDLNGDGSSVGEPGLSGWTVFIDEDGDGTLGASEPTAVSGTGGAYTITGVPLGSFTIRDVLPIGWKATAPGTGTQLVTLLNGENRAGIDFGNQQRTDGTIRGMAFNDKNKNGIREADEPGLAGIPVYMDTNNNGLFDAGEPLTTTSKDLFFTPTINEAGTYAFTHLPVGTYHVREVVPDVLSGTPAAARVNHIDLLGGEDRAGVNFANVFRPNEIHGVVYNDLNKNHVRDAGEPGIPGVTVYIDLNRDNVYQTTEPKTVTIADGSYSFITGLAPGAYVVREMKHSGHGQSYPTTTSGILWPAGVSNPAIGNVTPTSITESLAEGQTSSHAVSLTLPNAGPLTNKVDVFLLFDDTGSFTANSPIVRAAFPQIIATLQAAMPGVDLGFGVGRFEEYGNFALESASGRPFILNQPIIAQSTAGFSAAIQSALDRVAPGYGGDQPETDIEALFQTATGVGFDGNNNGTTVDSGAAGLVTTQITPGASGDVPSFGSFSVDPSGNVLPSDGSIGGAGFRPGALPIILTATDTGFAFQPDGSTSVTGVGGVTLPISALTQTSRGSTPFNSGATIQQTVTALNALGALVIGLGTNAAATVDPRQGLESLAKLTGAVNHSLITIPNGTLDPIAPGDPLYFQIASGFGASVANGIVTAIENATSAVNVNISLRASDPSVHLSTDVSVINNVGAGGTAAFLATFTGDGRPHRFDLQFVRQGTDVVLGSIPVVLGTPIDGDGYEYEEVEDGEIQNDSDFGDFLDVTLPTNNAPSFNAGANQTVASNAGPQSIPNWATAISPGPASEASQLVDFTTTNDNNALFTAQPTIRPDGTLTFTPAGIAGTATITVLLQDNGGTVNGGQDTSVAQTFTITLGVTTPLVVTTAFEFQSRQAITFDFNQAITGTLDPAEVQVKNLTTNTFIDVSSVTYDPSTHRATALFALTLPDGNYQATVAAGAVDNLTTAQQLPFFVLAGDANRDRTVDFADLVILAQNYNTAGRGFSQANFNYSSDGAVDFADLVILAQRYGTSIAPPLAGIVAVKVPTKSRKPVSLDLV